MLAGASFRKDARLLVMRHEKRPVHPFFRVDGSLAEKEGFEPSNRD